MRIAFLSSALPIFLGSLSLSLAADDHFPLLCGGCWCIYDPDTESCPAFGPGHYDVLEQPVSQAYASFQLITPDQDLPKLLSENGGECYPFTHVGPVDKFPKSNLPQCEAHPMAGIDGAVCAFKYDEGGDSCCNREYEMMTYESEEVAVDDGAVVTHFGACGVCSTATDLAVMGSKISKSGKALDTATIVCTVPYVTNVYTLGREPNAEFDTLVDCYKNQVGYSDECALLWAHSSATTSKLCLDQCSGSPSYNGPPPGCKLSNCIQCTEDVQDGQFLVFAGRSNTNSGITQPIARPCSDFYSVVHEPCEGNLPEPSECIDGDDTDPETSSTTRSAFSLTIFIYILSYTSLILEGMLNI